MYHNIHDLMVKNKENSSLVVKEISFRWIHSGGTSERSQERKDVGDGYKRSTLRFSLQYQQETERVRVGVFMRPSSLQNRWKLYRTLLTGINRRQGIYTVKSTNGRMAKK
uniref:Uncharacterized protein n=1 Tax=Homalodisca liturata TaxID=320908 RepID=A0A1B6IW99_9HEMI